MSAWEEKRQYMRACFRLKVECRGKSYWQYVETRDISAGGMFVLTDKVEPAKTKIEIMFEFEDHGQKKFIYAEGMVAWSRGKAFKNDAGEVIPPGMGIQFTKITPASGREYIDQMCKKAQEEKKDA